MGYEIEKGVRDYSKGIQGNEYFTINGKKTNFQIKEFACKDGTDLIKIDDELVEKLQVLRTYFANAIIINSGYRTPAYNKQVGGVDGSQHVLGKACDIVIKGHSPEEVGTIAKKIGFNGVGIYSTFTHVDTRSTPSYWIG